MGWAKHNPCACPSCPHSSPPLATRGLPGQTAKAAAKALWLAVSMQIGTSTASATVLKAKGRIVSSYTFAGLTLRSITYAPASTWASASLRTKDISPWAKNSANPLLPPGVIHSPMMIVGPLCRSLFSLQRPLIAPTVYSPFHLSIAQVKECSYSRLSSSFAFRTADAASGAYPSAPTRSA